MREIKQKNEGLQANTHTHTHTHTLIIDSINLEDTSHGTTKIQLTTIILCRTTWYHFVF